MDGVRRKFYRPEQVEANAVQRKRRLVHGIGKAGTKRRQETDQGAIRIHALQQDDAMSG